MLNRFITQKPVRREDRPSDGFTAAVCAAVFAVCCLVVAAVESGLLG